MYIIEYNLLLIFIVLLILNKPKNNIILKYKIDSFTWNKFRSILQIVNSAQFHNLNNIVYLHSWRTAPCSTILEIRCPKIRSKKLTKVESIK